MTNGLANTALAITLFLSSFTSSANAGVIDTTASWDGVTAIQPLGEDNTATYGQTFTAPGDNPLNSFTFYLENEIRTGDLDLRAYVYAWTGSNIAGPAIYTSGVVAVPQSLSGFQPFSFATGGVTLTPGDQYVAFLSASGLFDGTEDRVHWGFIDAGDPYAGGAFVYYNNGNDFSLLSSSPWDYTGFYQLDSAFKMDFGQVPEPSTLALLTAGLVLLLYATLMASGRHGV